MHKLIFLSGGEGGLPFFSLVTNDSSEIKEGHNEREREMSMIEKARGARKSDPWKICIYDVSPRRRGGYSTHIFF
jgi:hypothetical protein